MNEFLPLCTSAGRKEAAAVARQRRGPLWLVPVAWAPFWFSGCLGVSFGPPCIEQTGVLVERVRVE
ncbi:MAG TPA: hypothetical protein VLF66_13000, partial [Thermoanaerobaculia bacterium]|nr:hypothetical protein [Thermoanaerobaculia bacterium]